MVFAFATDNPAVLTQPLQEINRRYNNAGINTRCYTPELHQAAFVLPGYIQEALTQNKVIPCADTPPQEEPSALPTNPP